MDMQALPMADSPRVLFGFPTDVNSSFLRGLAKAPAAIRKVADRYDVRRGSSVRDILETVDRIPGKPVGADIARP